MVRQVETTPGVCAYCEHTRNEVELRRVWEHEHREYDFCEECFRTIEALRDRGYGVHRHPSGEAATLVLRRYLWLIRPL